MTGDIAARRRLRRPGEEPNGQGDVKVGNDALKLRARRPALFNTHGFKFSTTGDWTGLVYTTA